MTNHDRYAPPLTKQQILEAARAARARIAQLPSHERAAIERLSRIAASHEARAHLALLREDPAIPRGDTSGRREFSEPSLWRDCVDSFWAPISDRLFVELSDGSKWTRFRDGHEWICIRGPG